MDNLKPIAAQLKIKNLEELIETFSARRSSFYKGPYEIAGELERVVAYQEIAEPTILVSYKVDGDAIFDHVETKRDGDTAIHIYKFSTTAS